MLPAEFSLKTTWSPSDDLRSLKLERPLHIVAFTSYLYPWKLGLISRLRLRGTQARLFYYTNRGAYGVYEFMTTEDQSFVRLARIQLLQGRIDLPSPGAFLKLLRSAKCHVFLDIDSSFDLVQILLSFLSKARGAVVVRILAENKETRLHGSPMLVMLWRAKRALMRMSMKFSDLVIAESEGSVEYAIRAGVDAERIMQMTHGVDLTVFGTNHALSRESHSGAKEGRLTALYLGGFLMHKGIEYLVRAIESRRVDSLNFVVVSFGPLLSAYKRRLEKLNNVKLVAPVAHDKINELYSTAHIVVVPSVTTETDCERTPNVVLEAMGMGRAVIASRIGGIPDILGDAGIYIQERNEDEIVEALTDLDRNRDKLAEFMKRTRMRAVQLFDSDRYAQLVLRSITAVWQKRRDGPRGNVKGPRRAP